MNECSYTLGNAVRKARAKLDLTQGEVAEIANVDPRTVLNIENNRGNPKLEVLNSLIQALNIDAREIFNPGIQRESAELFKLRSLIDSCSDEEAAILIPCIESMLSVMRNKSAMTIE